MSIIPTYCRHEDSIETEGEKGLSKSTEKVFQKATYSMDVIHFAKWGHSFPSKELLLQLFHCAVTAWHSVQISLLKEQTFDHDPKHVYSEVSDSNLQQNPPPPQLQHLPPHPVQFYLMQTSLLNLIHT